MSKQVFQRILLCIGLAIGTALAVILTACMAVILWFFVSSFWADIRPVFRLLPSDREMIANFREHRKDFDRLVEIYRTDPSIISKRGLLTPTPEMRAIMDRINVCTLRGDMQAWIPPDPYSHKTTELLAILRNAGPNSMAMRKVSGVTLVYNQRPVKRLNDDLSDLNKGYYYAPLPPRVDKGFLRGPIWRHRLYRSLSWCPSDLLSADCVYRQIEPQWFIELCQG
jgi:hypothetical protein